MKNQPLYPRAYAVSVVWTLILLFLGSIVHTTESSLACPDWPTCFGTLLPAMEGGVFWEHLHRLVAGGLILMFVLSTWLARREAPERRWIFYASLAGLGLLLVQALFGALTVVFLLPDAVSTTHLALALLFLMLATSLAGATAPGNSGRQPLVEAERRSLRVWGGSATAVVFLQSLLGGVVRHIDAGMACPDVPLCLGQWVPPMSSPLVAVHFAHRLGGAVTVLLVCSAAYALLTSVRSSRVRHASIAVVALVLAQFGLGIASVILRLSVTPASLHTLVAAALLVATTLLFTWGRLTTGEVGMGRGMATVRGATALRG